MKKETNKFYAVLVTLLFSPLIVFGLLCALPCLLWDLLMEPGRKRKYRASRYYAVFQTPYRKGILYEAGYCFYNKAAEMGHDPCMIHPDDGGPDHLLIRDRVYLFPPEDAFGGISCNTASGVWELDYDEDFYPLDEEWEKHKRRIPASEQALPCFLLIKREDVLPCHDDTGENTDDCAIDRLPPYVRLVEEYTDILCDRDG